MKVDFLYSIENRPPDTDAAAMSRPIGRLQVLARGDEWDRVSTTTITGSDPYHQHWGKNVGGGSYRFYLTKISKNGP